jgi:endonuclease/exonuclease/phosphatase family metal-dependent hydrolase
MPAGRPRYEPRDLILNRIMLQCDPANQRDVHAACGSTWLVLVVVALVGCTPRASEPDKSQPEGLPGKQQAVSASRRAASAPTPAISLDEVQPTIRWQDAGTFMGREVQVVGTVTNTGRSKSGHVFLNFRDEDSEQQLTGFIHSKAAELFETPPDKSYRGKLVKIRGDLYLYKGEPNIRIAGPTRITELPPDTPLPEFAEPPKRVPRAPTDTITVAAYNVQNLFDSFDDQYRSDEGTAAKPRGALEALAQTIRRFDADVLALSEVENRGILEQFNSVLLPDLDYREVVHFEGNDRRGIDVALLSRLPVGPVTSYRHLEFPDANGQVMKFRRDLLRVRIEPEDGQAFDVFVVHFKSKGGLGGEAEEIRLGEAMSLRRILDEILAQDQEAALLVCGDFNDQWSSRSVQAVVGSGATALTGFVDRISGETDVTYNQEPYRSMIDFILASPAMARRYVKDSYRILPGSPSTSGSDHNPVIARFRIR